MKHFLLEVSDAPYLLSEINDAQVSGPGDDQKFFSDLYILYGADPTAKTF